MASKYRIEQIKSSDYEMWDDFVERSPQGCIFCKSWWLDAVAMGNFQIIGAFDRERLVGGIPLIRKNKRDGHYGMPPLTQTLGILLPDIQGKYVGTITKQKKIIDTIVDGIGDPDYFSQNFHYNYQNWLPFMWKGYKQTTRYTYVIQDISDKSVIWAGFAKNIKSDINKAKNAGVRIVDNCYDRKTFWDLYKKIFDRQKMITPINYHFFEQLDRCLEKRNKRKIFFAVGRDSAIHAAAYIVWDKDYAYYLMGGADAELRKSGATSLCLWEAIQFAPRVARKFDFEGSVVKNIERFFRAFGGLQTPYFQISKKRTRIQKLKKILKSLI